jgi:hypothetical protein
MFYQHFSLHSFSIFILTNFILLFPESNATRISLTGTDWLVSNGQSLQTTGRVPGTIHTALLCAKLIDEPYWGFGDITMRNLTYQSWTFTKKFSVEGDFLDLPRFFLHYHRRCIS